VCVCVYLYYPPNGDNYEVFNLPIRDRPTIGDVPGRNNGLFEILDASRFRLPKIVIVPA